VCASVSFLFYRCKTHANTHVCIFVYVSRLQDVMYTVKHQTRNHTRAHTCMHAHAQAIFMQSNIHVTCTAHRVRTWAFANSAAWTARAVSKGVASCLRESMCERKCQAWKTHMRAGRGRGDRGKTHRKRRTGTEGIFPAASDSNVNPADLISTISCVES